MNRSVQFSRRSFLKASAAAALPCILPSRVLGLGSSTSPGNRITIGMIGLGGQGNGHLGAFLGNGELQVLAVCDVDRGHRDAARNRVEESYARKSPSGIYKGCTAYNDFREVLARSDVDAVLVATPENWHSLITIAAARAGKDIYCEKPFAPTIAEGRAAVEAVKRYSRILQVGSQERSRATCRYACELVRNGRLGKIREIHVNLPTDHRMTGIQQAQPIPEGFDYDLWLGPAPWAPYTAERCHVNFRWILDYSDGELTDRGAHVGDLAQWGNGTDRSGPVEIEGKGVFPQEGLWNAAVDFDIHGRYANGVDMFIRSVEPRGVKFVGEFGWVFIHIHGGHLEASPRSLLKEPIRANDLHLYDDTNDHHRNWLECIRTRKEPIAPAECGHRTTSLCHLGNIAMLLGRKLNWDPAREVFVNDDEANRLISRTMRAPWTF